MPSVILVEDDPMIGEIYQKKLNSSGFEATVATSGKDFFGKIALKKYDLALVDMVLPETSGLDILREVKKSGKYDPQMKVFIFSNLNSQEDRDKAMQNGADGFISKTQYNPSDLVKKIQQIIGKEEISEEKITNNNSGVIPENVREKNRVLFIEDERVILESLGEKLEENGFVVEKALDGALGMKQALAKDFDLIIIDSVMPSMGGMDIIKRLRLEEKTKNIPVILLSASPEDRSEKEMEALGISDFFVKTTVVPSELAERVKELLK